MTNCVSISFVGVLSQSIKLPMLSNDFCQRLFGNPSETFNGLTPEGYVIALNGKPMPMIIFNSQKFVFKAANKEELEGYISAVKEELGSIGIHPNFSAYGMNYEYEWLHRGSSAESWMWERFIGKNVVPSSSYHVCNSISLRIGINETERMNIKIEPRVGKTDGIFVSFNHHHEEQLTELPKPETLNEIYMKSKSCLDTTVIPEIIGEE